MPTLSQTQPKEGAVKLLSYVETYRSMIEKINKFDKIIERNGTGKTLDMSSGIKRKRTYTMRKGGKESPGSGGSYPKHVHDYQNFVLCLRKLQL